MKRKLKILCLIMACLMMLCVLSAWVKEQANIGETNLTESENYTESATGISPDLYMMCKEMDGALSVGL